MRGKDVVVLGVEKKSVLQLQDPRTVRKVVALDDHVALAFAGVCSDWADASVLCRLRLLILLTLLHNQGSQQTVAF